MRFLVQLAAIALHAAGRAEPFTFADAWRSALIAFIPGHPDRAPFALIVPDERPAFLQAPCKSDESHAWKKRLSTPDALDMLVTSRNHDIKIARMVHANPEDWIFALVSLQTQEGFLGAGNYGISRMNGGFASRPAFGVVPSGHWGRRWRRDVHRLLEERAWIANRNELADKDGLALVWLRSWDGASSIAFSELDPFYIEICRRVRLSREGERIVARGTGSRAARIAAKERNGMTGDAWTPINAVQAKALSITAKGFDYRLASTLAFSNEFERTIASKLLESDGDEGIVLLAQGITRGQGKTEGYHERRIPISPGMIGWIRRHGTDEIAQRAETRIVAIGEVRKVLWSAMCGLLGNGDSNVSDETKRKVGDFSREFEQAEDTRFFDDLIEEVDAQTNNAKTRVHEAWLCALVDRAAATLERAFDSGPRSAERRYLAQAAALSRFHGGVRSTKLPTLARVLRERSEARKMIEEA
ncbi:type I-E CRISPR-associated protein Cse1/CasA [Candidatus Burkholderia verschuerenii]|uniref:type I-E CRISPR-associated protein Cse1/CasA n=1 Tax=Candidatus Burkholderia verschuerenii TaxID=242163 RepID=UPI001E39BB8A|nr:type I-E CRISPR-associated protein Cse1/CasA [Candidatus Burkholderia verschuerenii]